MTEPIPAEIERLRNQLFRTRIASLLAVLLLAGFTVVRTGGNRPTAVELKSGGYSSSLTAAELRVGHARFNSSGIFTAIRTPNEQDSILSAKADASKATIGASYEGRGFDWEANKTPIVRLTVDGKVKSELLVDTDTGEWRLLRSKVVDGQTIRTSLQLATPL